MPLTLTHVGLPPRLQRLLRDTSRSFYLTLQVLPGPVRAQIGLAYLLARATDTVADTELVPVEERLTALEGLRDRILGTRAEPVNLARLIASQAGQSSLAERRLLDRLEDAVAQLAKVREADARDIRDVLKIITGGQDLDLRRFELPLTPPPVPTPIEATEPPRLVPPVIGQPAASRPTGDAPRELRALTTDAELDDYTYRVAGCVGEFWTRLTRRHCFPKVRLDEPAFFADGRAFGQGLQLVNILRDLPRDLRSGRCYLPTERLTAFGLQPTDLLDPANEPRLRPLYRELVERAFRQLEAGWRYTNTIPCRHFRLRLACAWPILIGVQTLVKLLAANPLDPAQRVKVSRREVRQILVGSLWRVPWPTAWASQFQRALETP
jgi:farnesyl-diphosphate farnesyltransferase